MEAVEAQGTFTMEQGGWSEMFETQAEPHYIQLYFQTSALEPKGGFHVLDPDMAASPSYPRALDENVINLGSASEERRTAHVRSDRIVEYREVLKRLNAHGD